MSSPKRLFIGFPVQPTDSLLAAVKKLRIGSDRREIEFDWAAVENYHVTLNFLGSVESERISEIGHLMSGLVSAHPPFPTSVRGLGGFPDEHHTRVLWAGVRKSRQLTILQSDLTEGLASLGFEPEEREYIPHLTLARTRKPRSGKDLISPYVRTSFGDIEVGSVVLYESVMHGPRPHYEPLETFALNPAAVEIA